MSAAKHTQVRGCPECAWGKVAGCWRCGSRITAHSVAHMSECRRQKHDAAVQWRKLWRALVGVGAGWTPDAKDARQQMRDCVAAARFYRKGQRHYTAILSATGAAS